MITYTIHHAGLQNGISRTEIARFLHQHLGQYGDPEPAIAKAIDYALGEPPAQGGFVLTAREGEELLGAVVVNDTGMGDYIPAHILVYVAVRQSARGKGIGRELVRRTLDACQGDLALHVEPDNPARRLYERLGFTSRYLEMRHKA